MSRFEDFQRRLNARELLILDGAFGTELQRRGIATTLPLWSAAANKENPDAVRSIHRDYIQAGADITTTNTFRTNLRTFKRAGIAESPRDYTLRACELAREARDQAGRDEVVIGGSIAPVEDCYEPSLVPSDEELREEHGLLAQWLTEGGVDFIFVETMNCIRESVAAAEAALHTELPLAVGFVCTAEGILLSGETIADTAQALEAYRPFALCTNCRPLESIEPSVDALLTLNTLPIGVYANGAGRPDDDQGWLFDGKDPELDYAERARAWIEKGVVILGGCCGTTPEYIRRLAEMRRL